MNQPRVGVGAMILKDRKVLLGKRKGSHGSGLFAFPGGHLEYMESFEDCAAREILEETGLLVHNFRLQVVGNTTMYAPKHYVHIGLTCDWKSGEPQLLEPEKCEGWDWYALDKLPEPLMPLTHWGIVAYLANRVLCKTLP